MERILLAMPFYPSVDAFEAIGIKLEKTSNFELMSATLPENWRAEEEGNWVANTVKVFDEKGRQRAYSVHVAPSSRHVICSSTSLNRRYVVMSKAEGELGQQTFEVVLVDTADGTVLFSAGKTKYEPWHDDKKRKLHSGHELVKMCEDFATEKFPDWENCLSYWDE